MIILQIIGVFMSEDIGVIKEQFVDEKKINTFLKINIYAPIGIPDFPATHCYVRSDKGAISLEEVNNEFIITLFNSGQGLMCCPESMMEKVMAEGGSKLEFKFSNMFAFSPFPDWIEIAGGPVPIFLLN